MAEEEKPRVTRKVTEDETGILVYPGAELLEGGSRSESTEDGMSTMSGGVLLAGDEVLRVVTWYKERLSGMKDLLDVSMVEGGEETGTFEFTSEGARKYVNITKGEETGKTEIEFASIPEYSDEAL